MNAVGGGFEVALRFDTEDFLTPESDAALERILDGLEARGLRATFPVVGQKLRGWLRDGRDDLVRRLRRQDVGYHSDTHSLHPTIAEELADLGWAQACTAFAARERRGYEQVRDSFGPPACWTQPGGNWTAAALAAVRDWGLRMDFSESWNSYLDCGPAPCRYAGLLHWSAPVSAPKPFLSHLPQALAIALDQVRSERLAATPLCIVAHPTELCTTTFWDSVNFGAGHTPPASDWRPAPLRPAADIQAAGEAFGAYLDGLQRMGASFVTATDLVRRHPDLAAGTRLPARGLDGICRLTLAGLDPLTCAGLALSPAEIFGLLVATAARWPDGPAAAGPGENLAVRAGDGPELPPPEPPGAGSAGRDAWLLAARWCNAHVERHRRVPSAVPLGRASIGPAACARSIARLLLEPCADQIAVASDTVPCEAIVKPIEALHWDWPIFAPGFRPLGLRQMARLQAWTWKPAPAWPRRPDWVHDAWCRQPPPAAPTD